MKLHLVILQNIITLNPHDIAIAMPVRHNCVAVDRQYSEQSEVNRELKQQRQRRLRKRHLKSEFALFRLCRAYSISFSSSDVGNFLWS